MLHRHCAIFLLTALFFGGFGLEAAAQNKEFTATNPPQPVAPFQFEGEKGQPFDLKSFRGRYVLLNIWATSCAPCVAEMPALNELDKKLDPGRFVIIALTEDHDGVDMAKLFYQRNGIDHLAIYNDPSGRAPFALRIHGLPTTLLINPEGFEVARLEGSAEWDQDSMISFLKAQAVH